MHCGNCGAGVAEGAAFCGECGTRTEQQAGQPAPVAAGTIDLTAIQDKQKAALSALRNLSLPAKLGIGLAGVAITIVLIVSAVLQSQWRGEAAVARLCRALEAGDAAQVAALLVPGDSAMVVNAETVKPLMAYMAENREHIPQVRDDLTARAKEASGSKAAASSRTRYFSGSQSSSVFDLRQEKVLWIPRTRIVLKPLYVKVSSDLDNVQVEVDGADAVTIAAAGTPVQVKPLVPGKHDFVARYAGEFITLERKQEFTAFVAETAQHLDLDFNPRRLWISSSDYADASVYVNGKATGKTVKDFPDSTITPLQRDTPVELEMTFPWGAMKSTPFTPDDRDIRFAGDAAFRKGIMDTVAAFGRSITAATKSGSVELLTDCTPDAVEKLRYYVEAKSPHQPSLLRFRDSACQVRKRHNGTYYYECPAKVVFPTGNTYWVYTLIPDADGTTWRVDDWSIPWRSWEDEPGDTEVAL